MDKIVDLQNLKSKNYMSLSISLKELLFAYWNLLKYEPNHIFTNNLSLTYEIVKVLNLSDEIKNVSFEDNISYIGGYYNFKEKRLTLNIKKLLQLRNFNIVSCNAFIVEYLTILFHEIFHAIQYQYMNNCNDYLISTMKKLSISIKQNINLNNQLHDLIPDEREASIESAKLIYYFAQQSQLLNVEECDDTYKNLNFYLKNGYLYNKNLSIYPYQSISKFDNTIPMLVYENLDTYNRLIYGLDIADNPTLSLLLNENNKRLLKL